jgi:hypothetical protein
MCVVRVHACMSVPFFKQMFLLMVYPINLEDLKMCLYVFFYKCLYVCLKSIYLSTVFIRAAAHTLPCSRFCLCDLKFERFLKAKLSLPSDLRVSRQND